MSARKKEKADWSFCSSCDRYFPRNIFVKHQKKCCEDSVNGEISVVDCGYVQDGIFYGVIKCCDALQDERIPILKNDLIIIHPATLKFCSLQVASSVVLTYGGHETCGTLWPSSTIALDCIGLKLTKVETLNVQDGDLVALEKIDKISIIANSVSLQPLNNKQIVSDYNEISEYILHELDGCNILCGDVVSYTHYGSKINFLVNEIHGDVGSLQVTPTVCSLDDELMALSLRGDCSTPAKQKSIQLNKSHFDDKVLYVYSVAFHETKIIIQNEKQSTDVVLNVNNLEKIGGMSSQVKLLDELIAFPFKYPSVYSDCGISPPKGIILFGPSGTGKTNLAHSFSSKLSGVFCSTINGPELTSKFYGETEQKLRNIFTETLEKAPSILIIDEFDTLCPIRNSSSNESEKRVVSTLVTLMDNIMPNVSFVVIAVTSNIDAVDMALRRPGRFDREIEIGVPNVSSRLDILEKLMSTCKHSLKPVDFIELSEITHGYVGADLSALCKEAGLTAIRKVMSNMTDVSVLSSFSIHMEDFKTALCKVGPSAMKAVTVDIPKVYWKDIGGQDSVKQKLKEAIEWPLKHPGAFQRLGITPPRGLLMYGPPGCSKTLMAKALATESGLNFISIKGPELFNKFLGESERAVRDVFHKARLAAPSIVFFDEIDALSVQRASKDGGSVGDRVLSQILTELDGVESLHGVIVVAATNRPDVIDPALLRPGRIDRLIYVPLPDRTSRKEIFEIQFRSMPVSDVIIEDLVSLSEGYSGAEICSMCREAALMALRDDFECEEVKQKHFHSIFDQIKPATSKTVIDFYNDFVSKTTGSF